MGAGQSSSRKDHGSCCQQLQWSRPTTTAGGKQPPTAAAGQADVSLRITAHVASTEGKGTNMVLSPLLLRLVLGMVAAGSMGPTRDQILSFVGSESTDKLSQLASDMVSTLADGSPNGGPKLCFVNGVWVDSCLCFKQPFKHILDHVYKAAAQQVDFHNKATEVTKEINSWVESNTNGLIKELLPSGSIDGTTKLVFANSLYFKGKWKHKFDQSRTRDSNFYLLHGRSVKVPFMTSREDQFISTFDGFKVLRLCYEQDRNNNNRQFSMYIFLPNAKDGLSALIKNLISQSDFLDRHIPRIRVGVGDFMIPRFKFSFQFEASNTLKRLGLTSLFSNPDLTEMVESEIVGKKLCVSRIFHKAFIEVNEEGTEAAAATAAVVMFRSANFCPEKVDFVADHPFLFFIREDVGGGVLFVGHVMNPLNNN